MAAVSLGDLLFIAAAAVEGAKCGADVVPL